MNDGAVTDHGWWRMTTARPVAGRAVMERSTAETYASWFRCLADPTRLQLLQLLATRGDPATIGELVEALGVGQSTVSTHVRRLEDLEFVFVERVGTASFVRINADCLTAFPTAADVVMGRSPVRAAGSPAPAVPWRTTSTS